MLSQRVAEKCRRREDEVTKMKDAVEQSREVISDCKDECTTLVNTVAAVDNKLEQTKEVCVSASIILFFNCTSFSGLLEPLGFPVVL